MSGIKDLRIYFGGIGKNYEPLHGFNWKENCNGGNPGDGYIEISAELLLLRGAVSNEGLLENICKDPRIVAASQMVYLPSKFKKQSFSDGNLQLMLYSETSTFSAYDVWGKNPVDVFNFAVKAASFRIESMPEELKFYSSYMFPDASTFKPTLGDIVVNTFGKWWKRFKDETGMSVYEVADIKTYGAFKGHCGGWNPEALRVLEERYDLTYHSPLKLERAGNDVYMYLLNEFGRKVACLEVLGKEFVRKR